MLTTFIILRYDAQYPDPPKVSMDTAIARCKIAHPEQNTTLEQYDDLRDDWRSKDMVTKFLGLFSSQIMYADWCVTGLNGQKKGNMEHICI